MLFNIDDNLEMDENFYGKIINISTLRMTYYKQLIFELDDVYQKFAL